MMWEGDRLRAVLLSYDFGEYCIRLASALAGEATLSLLLARVQAEPHLSKLSPTVDFRPFDKPRLRQAPRQLVRTLELVRTIRRLNPDVIHFQRGHLWFNLALPLLKRYPLVLTVHDPRHHLGDRESQKTPQSIMDFGYRRAERLIVHGEQLKRVLVQECGIAEAIIHVMPMVPHGDGGAPAAGEETAGTVLFFGRIWEYKGLEYLIRAEPLITAQAPDARIVIAGRGEDFKRYRSMMVHPERFTVYNEYVSHEQREELFRQASVVVLPYVDASQSAVVPIAYSHGKPVVATTVGGLPELVDDGRTGLLVPPRDERALAEAVVRLLRNADLRRRMGAEGRRKIEHDVSVEAVARQTLGVYRLAVEGRRRGLAHHRREEMEIDELHVSSSNHPG